MQDYSLGTRREPSVVFGYGGLDEGSIERGIARLAAALDE
jgi:hypothetical protein